MPLIWGFVFAFAFSKLAGYSREQALRENYSIVFSIFIVAALLDSLIAFKQLKNRQIENESRTDLN